MLSRLCRFPFQRLRTSLQIEMSTSVIGHESVVTTLPQHGDRVQKQNGDTALKQPGVINVTSWEIEHPTCRETCCAAMKCAIYDTTRAYIYVRDNRSIEVNDTNSIKSCCSCCCQVQDNVSVNYFDRSPYSKQCNLSPPVAWLCCMPCYFTEPKLEILDDGYMCCCIKFNFANLCGWGGKKVVLMPFEMMPPPCCCCSNRTCWLQNCCNLCGPPSGNPIFYHMFSPQPQNPAAFIQSAMGIKNGKKDSLLQVASASVSGAPETIEIER